MPTYIHELSDWPQFRFDAQRLLTPLAEAKRHQGLLIGRLEGMGINDHKQAKVIAMVSEAITSSEIEGEILDAEKVRSSIARRLGIEYGGIPNDDHRIEGVAEMTVDAAENWTTALTKDRLLNWQAGLFPGGRGPYGRVRTGEWRKDEKGPMQVVSGPIGKELVHFEAPESKCIEKEMRQFLSWFERKDESDWVINAGIAHLWFETIHPFDDGNGRVGRAIIDLALARADRGGLRCYSLSSQLRKERSEYYNRLEAAQKSDLDATPWLVWFIGCLESALVSATETASEAIQRSRFWLRFSASGLNERQHRLVSRMLLGWEAKMTVEKWAAMSKTSPSTAKRDLVELHDKGILLRVSKGRGTGYVLVPIENFELP